MGGVMGNASVMVVRFKRPEEERFMVEHLRAFGHEVLLDWNGGEASVDLFLLDAIWARLLGPEIMARKTASEVFLPALVAIDLHDDASVWLESGFDDCLFMPTTKAMLRVRTGAFLMLRHQSQALTERHNSALQRSEEKYRILAETAGDFIFMHDTEGRITYANRAGLERFGYSPEDILSANVADLVGPGGQPVIDQNRSSRQEGDWSTLIYETVFRDAHGREIPIEASSTPLIEDGRIVSMVLNVRDITDRRRFEEEANAAAAQWQATFDASKDAFWILDRSQHVVRANRASGELLGEPAEALVGRQCWEMVHKTTEPIEGCPFVRSVGTGQRESMDLPFGDRTLRVTVDPIVNDAGELTGAVHIMQDVTDEVMARQRDARLTRALTGLHRCSRLLRRSGDDWLEVTLDEVSESFGLDRVWLIDGRTEAPSFLIRGEAGAADATQHFIQNEKWRGCFALARQKVGAFVPKGGRACADCPMHPESGETCMIARVERQGELVGVLGAMAAEDVLADERYLAAFGLLSEDVGSAFVARQAETEREHFRRQLAQAQRLEAVGRLAGGLAHDFNNMLTVVGAGATFIQDGLREHDPLLDDVRMIMEGVDRAAKLTRQLLAFSRNQIVEFRMIDLNGLVTDLDRMLGRLLGEDIVLSLQLAEQDVTIHADPGQIEQIIVNLASNARDAMDEGGCLTIETDVVRLDDAYLRGHVDGLWETMRCWQ